MTNKNSNNEITYLKAQVAALELLLSVHEQTVIKQYDEEIVRLKLQNSALEQLLTVHEQAVLEQSDRLEQLVQSLKNVHDEQEMRIENRTAELAKTNAKLQQQILEHKQTQDKLTEQTTQLTTVTQIGTAVAQILDTDTLLQQAVDLIKSNFKLYHTQIYLFNDVRSDLVLAVEAGEIDHKMAARDLIISFDNQQSLVAQTARTQQGTIINNVQKDTAWLPNTLLPDTHAQMTVPLIVGKEILGVLNLQADTVDYFSESDLRIQTILVAQVAIALQNARSFKRSEQTLQELNNLTRQLQREGWENYLASTEFENDFAYDLNRVTPRAEDLIEINQIDQSTITQPLLVQNEPIGQITIVDPQHLTHQTSKIMEAVADRLGTHIENLRLTNQTQQALHQTETLYEAINNVVRASTLDEVLLALVGSTIIKQFDRANIIFFDQIWAKTPPKEIIVAAVWEQSGQPSRAPAGTRYLATELPFLAFLNRNESTFVADITTDERMDESTRHVLVDQLKMQSLVIFPLVVGEDWIGIVTAQSGTAITEVAEQVRQISSLVDQAAVVIQNQQLFERTQQTLAETENLYNASRRVNEAGNLQELVAAVAEGGPTPIINRMVLHLFDYNSMGEMEASLVAANWYSGQGNPPTASGVRYLRKEFPTIELFNSPVPVFFDDALHDNRIDPTTKALLHRLNVQAMGVLSLSVGARPLGALLLQADEPYKFTEREIQSYLSLSQQMATAIENQRLLETAQNRATREQTLREVVGRIQGSVDVDTILRTAAQEVGQALGRSAFVYLGNGDKKEE